MRLTITVNAARGISLPLHYNHLVQGFIYQQLEPNLAKWLHGNAYTFAQRTYKMFTFSRLMGSYQVEPQSKTISFSGPVSFKLASHNTQILASLAEHLLKSSSVRLGTNTLELQGIEILKPPCYRSPIKLKTLSPITIYSTFEKPGGGKVTHYYAPHEKTWSEMLLANLARKAKALEWQDDIAKSLEGAYIKPLSNNPKDKKVIKYKSYVMEAYAGLFEAKLPQAYFELAYDVGLGGKNAQGLGMVEVC
jgi:CRISPR-associated endoribonuclease Cas6